MKIKKASAKNYDKNANKESETLILGPAVDAYGNPGMKIRWPNGGNTNPFFFIKK